MLLLEYEYYSHLMLVLLLHSEQALGSSAPASWSLHVCVGLVQVLRLATYSKHVRLYVEWWLYCYYLSV